MAVALITGTSTGIGLASAVTLARAGHTVYATMRNLERATELQAAVSQEKLPVTVLALDVDSDDSITAAVGKVLSKSGQIDVLVNNAGVNISGPVEELPLAGFRQTMETNFFGPLRCIKAVLPGMRERRSGCIVNVSSVAGRISVAPQSSYSASKWALEALSEALAAELKAFQIRVAIVEPGVIQTSIRGKERPISGATRYPHQRRMKALYEASLKNPVSPQVVAEKIRQIVESGNWQLR